MKTLFKTLTAIVLTLTLIAGTAALACDEYYDEYCGVYYDYGNSYIWDYGTVVATGGSSYIRTAPGLYGDVIGSLSKGCAAVYRGASDVDSRGVRWDYICYNGVEGWVSSRYTTLY